MRLRRLILLISMLVTLAVWLVAFAGVAEAQRPLSAQQAKTSILEDLEITFFGVPAYRHEYVLEEPVSVGIRSCTRLTPYKIECVGLVRSRGTEGEEQVCAVHGETAHRAKRGPSISTYGFGKVTCRIREPGQ